MQHVFGVILKKNKNDIGSLINQLDMALIPARSRIKWLAEKTGYSRTLVGDVLGGRRTYTDRFKKMAHDAIQNELLKLSKKFPNIMASAVKPPVFNPDEAEQERIDREVFGLISQERREKERFISGLVRRLPDDKLQPVEDFIFDMVKGSK